MVSEACCGPDRDRHDFRGLAGLLQANGFLDGDLVERVHRHFHVGQVDPAAIRFDPDFHVVIDHPLDRDDDLHEALK